MKEINIMYRIASSYSYPVDLDEYKQDILDRYEKPWGELTKDEKDEFIYDLGIELAETVEEESDRAIETVDGYEDGGKLFFI